MPGTLDHLLFGLLAIGLPVYGAFTWKSFKQKLLEGKRNVLLHAYWETIIVQWSLYTLVIVIWFFGKRSFSDLGLAVTWNLRFLAGILLGLGGAGFFIKQWLDVKRLQEIPDTLKDQVLPVASLMPQTPKELKSFVAVSITAGICEEVLYRGFMIWYLKAITGILPAVILSVLIFGLAHAYQGREGIVKTSLMGLILVAIYLLSGSLIGPILLHAVTDVTGGLIGSLIVRRGIAGGSPAN